MIGLSYPPRKLYRLFLWKNYRNHDLPKSAKIVNHMLKSVTLLLSIFLNVMVVISTITKIIGAITTPRQTQQDVLAEQAAIKQNLFVKNEKNCVRAQLSSTVARQRFGFQTRPLHSHDRINLQFFISNLYLYIFQDTRFAVSYHNYRSGFNIITWLFQTVF